MPYTDAFPCPQAAGMTFYKYYISMSSIRCICGYELLYYSALCTIYYMSPSYRSGYFRWRHATYRRVPLLRISFLSRWKQGLITYKEIYEGDSYMRASALFAYQITTGLTTIPTLAYLELVYLLMWGWENL
jgi:hypothetical protein